MNSGMRDQYYNDKIETHSITKAGHTIEIEVIRGEIQYLKGRNNYRDDRNRG